MESNTHTNKSKITYQNIHENESTQSDHNYIHDST